MEDLLHITDGGKIVALRKLNHLTQERFGAAALIKSSSTLVKMEKTERFSELSDDTLLRLYYVLNEMCVRKMETMEERYAASVLKEIAGELNTRSKRLYQESMEKPQKVARIIVTEGEVAVTSRRASRGETQETGTKDKRRTVTYI